MLPLAPDDPDLCRDYAQRHDGDNNSDPETNGEVAILRQTIPACRTVFDVGANRGAWTDTVLSINPGARIHAFEPGARSFAALEAKRLPPNVTLNRLALGAAAEQRELHLFGDHSELSSLYRREALDGFPVERSDATEPVTTLDAYCASHGIEQIDYLKVDTEGHDLKVLQGAREKFTAHAIGIVQFEYGMANIDSRDLLKDFFAFFADLRYDLIKLRAQGLAPFPRYDARLENFTYQNWIAARRGAPAT
jgi:FkbM family methyltransferase